MDQVLLRKLHQEVSVKSDVKLNVARGSLGLGDVQVETLVKHFDCLIFVAFFAPFYHSLQIGVLGSLVGSLLVVYLFKEFKLGSCIVNHLLFNAAEDHAVKRD